MLVFSCEDSNVNERTRITKNKMKLRHNALAGANTHGKPFALEIFVEGLEVHAFGGTGSRCMLLAGQVRKISCPPVAKRVINLPYDPAE